MQQQKTIPLRAWAELLLLGCIWGASFLSHRIALAEMGFLSIVAFRVTGATLVLWSVVRLRGLPVPRAPKIWASFLAVGALNTALPFSLIVWGQQRIDSGLAGILNASTALFGVVVASLFFADERLTLRRGIGVGLGFCGVAMALGLDRMAGFDPSSLSQLALLGSSLCYAFGGSFARRALHGVAPEVSSAGMLAGAAVVMVPIALWNEGLPSPDHGPQVWGALIYLAVVSTALADLLYYRVLAQAGAGNLSLSTLIVAPVAIVLGAIVFDENLGLNAYAGFGLLALGLMVLDGRVLRILWPVKSQTGQP